MIADYFILPNQPAPIFIIGAGGIVTDAHLPAYKLAGFEVKGIFDLDLDKATVVAQKFSLPAVYSNLQEMVQAAGQDSVFDIAVPGSAIIETIMQLPDRASTLIQKPMGETFAMARDILSIVRKKQMNAGVNFQLRYAPYITQVRRLIADGKIGDLCDIEVNVNVFMPWNLWKFLYDLPRVEILYHSIHYVDLIRSFFGNPVSVYAKTTKHPAMKDLASVRSNIIMDYGDMLRAAIHTNHNHEFGPKNQNAYIKFEGTRGAIKVSLGLLMDYPNGVPDILEYCSLDDGREWREIKPEGSWFPHAFIGSMAQVMLAKEGTIKHPDNAVEDCIHTMACIEAAYQSNETGGIKMDNYSIESRRELK